MADLATKFSIPKLNEKNYSIWVMLVEAAAHSVMGYAILTTPVRAPAVPDLAKSSEAEIAAYKTFYTVLTLLMTSISEQCLYIIRTKSKTPNDIWIALREHFLPSTNRNVIRLRGNFYRTSLNAFPSMSKYIDSINMQAEMINQLLEEIAVKNASLHSSSEKPPFITQMEKLTVLLYGLGDSYETTREILENEANITFESACLRLKEKAEFSTLPNSTASSSSSGATQRVDHANVVVTQKKGRKRQPCEHCAGRHASERCFSKFPHLRPNSGQNAGSSSSSGSATLSAQANPARSGNVTPNSSNASNSGGSRQSQVSHTVQPTMPNRAHANRQQNAANSVEEAWAIEKISIDVSALLATAADATLPLLIDSGASSHILGRDFRPHLVNWRRGAMIRIAVADSRICESEWIADLPFAVESTDGIRNVILHDIIFMPDFPRGLISVAKLAERGVETIFSGPGCVIRSKSFSVDIKKDPHKDLYFLPTLLPHLEIVDLNIEEANLDELVNIPSTQADPEVISSAQRKLHDLHASLGHCSLRTLRSAVVNGHIKGVMLADLSCTLEACEVCKTAKLCAHTT